MSHWRAPLRKFSRFILAILLGIFAVLTLLLGLVLAVMEFPNVALRPVNRILEPVFEGRLVINDIQKVSLHGAVGVDAIVIDPQGKTVAQVHDLSGKIDVIDLLREVLSSSQDLNLLIRDIQAKHIELSLDTGLDGALRLAQALTPTPSSRPAKNTSGAVNVVISNIDVENAWVYGSPSPALPLDLSLKQLSTSLRYEQQWLTIAPVVGAGVARAPVSGPLQLNAELRLRFFEEQAGASEVVDPLIDLESASKAELTIGDSSVYVTFDRAAPRVESQIQLRLSAEHARELKLGHADVDLDLAVQGTAAQLEAQIRSLSPGAQAQAHIKLTQDSSVQRVSGILSTQAFDLARVGVDELSPITSELKWSLAHVRTRPFADLLAYEAELSGQVQSFQLMAQRIPTVSIKASAQNGKIQALVIPLNEAHVSERDAANRINAQIQLGSAGSFESAAVELDFDAAWLNLVDERLTVGPGRLKAEGRYDAASQLIQLKANCELARSAWDKQVRAEHLELSVYAAGSLMDPHISTQIKAREIQAADRSFDGVTVTAQGTLSSALVSGRVTEQERSLELSAKLRWNEPGFTIERARLTVDAARTSVGFEVDQITIEARRTHFDGLRTTSVPDARLSGAIYPDRIDVRGSLRDVAIGRWSETLGIADVPVDGVIDLDTDISVGSGYVKGRAHVLVSFLTVKQELQLALPPVHLELDAVGTGRALDLVAHLHRQDGKDTAPHAEFTLHTQTPRLSEFNQTELLFSRLQSFELQGFLPLRLANKWLPPDVALDGNVHVFAELDRENQRDFPEVKLRASTLGLIAHLPLSRANESVTGPENAAVTESATAVESTTATERATASSSEIKMMSEQESVNESKTSDTSSPKNNVQKRVVSEDIDLTLSASYSPSRGETRLLVGASSNDQLLIGARLAIDRSPRTLLDFSREQLMDLPMEGELWVLPRDLASWPEPLRSTTLRGRVKGRASLRGSLSRPQLEASINGTNLAFVQDEEWELIAKESSARFHYDSKELTVQFNSSGGDRFHAEVDARLLAPWDALQMRPVPHELDAKINLERLPLSLIPTLAHRSIQGSAGAKVTISDWGTDKRLVEGRVTLNDATIDEIPINGAELKLGVDPERARLDLSLNQNDYRFEAHGEAVLVNDSSWLPTVSDSIHADVLVEEFPLELLRPFVGSVLAELTGTLHAQAHLEREGTKQELGGDISIKDGSFQIPQLGQRFSDVDARLQVMRDGRILMKNASFRGASGKGSLQLDGQMDAWRPKNLQARLTVDRQERLPLSMAGLGLGEFWGDIETEVDLEYEKKEIIVSTKVREFQLRFPELPTSQVQGLGASEDVFVGTQLKNNEWVEIPLQPVSNSTASDDPWRLLVRIDLGKKLWLQQGPTRRVQLEGQFEIDAKEQLRIAGQIRIPRGRVEINGRMFEVSEGTLSFQEDDPSNPILLAEARWLSSEGIAVVARFSGPVKNGEMSLSSEPALPQDQVLSLLLFGDTGGLSNLGADQAQSDSAAQAAQIGGSFASLGLNKALGRVDAVDLSTRVRSSDSGGVRPEVVMQLTNSLSAQLGYNLEEPSPGKSPDRTLLSFELRVVGGHSLSATVGDRGSSLLDWVWRYKY